jgi:bifunctional non-homologous end joining protein LigD
MNVNTTTNKTSAAASAKSGVNMPAPEQVKPMLATLVDKPFDDPNWIYEVKWDGYRALAFVNNHEAELRSRNNKIFNEKFYPIHKALAKLDINAIFDGEIIVLDNKGTSDFGALQTWRSEADGELVYYVFDILWLNGEDLMPLPLSKRREILEQIKLDTDIIRLSRLFSAGGTDFFKAADKMGLEGIIAKKANSIYLPDVRSKDWLKIKTEKRQEVIIGGYTRNENSSRKISALLVGMFEGDVFKSVGTVGTGFSGAIQNEIIQTLEPYQIAESPFETMPEFNKPSRFRPNPPKAEVTWVKPEIVIEIGYREAGTSGLRQPSFKGLRPDKNAREVTWETAGDTNQLVKEQEVLAPHKLFNAPKSKSRKTFLNPKDESQVRNIGGHDIKFNNLSKIYWPEINLTKRDMLNYYYQVAPYILPYLINRPHSLNRFPNGIYGKSFYQKDVTGRVPDWVETFLYHSDADERDKHFFVCTDEASLLLMASMGCIELNPWSSRTELPDNPDFCIIDLDPDKNTFEQVIEAARVVKEVLDAMGVPSYPKTSGSTGIHIYIPLEAKYTYEQSKEFGRLIAKIVHDRIPGYTSIERKTADRGGKMYIDFLQNRPQATIAGPYSLRPKPGATVSMPLHWDEVKPGLKMNNFTMLNAINRIKAEGDLFEGVLGKGIDMEEAQTKAKSLLKGG